MKLKKILFIAALVLVNILYSLGIVANAAEASTSTTNIILKGDEKDFTLDLSVDNNGKTYSGAEFGIRLNGVELIGIKYNVTNYSQAGPIVKNGVTYFGFFNTKNMYSDGQVCTLSLRYTGNDNVKMIIEESQITTRVNDNKVTGDKKNPNIEIKVGKEQSNNSNQSDNPSNTNTNNNSNPGIIDTGNSSNNSNSNTNTNTNSNININTSDNNVGDSSTSNSKDVITFAPTDKIPTDNIIKLLKTKDNNIVVNLTKPDIVTKEVFEALQGKNINITFNIEDEKGQTIISWTFNGLNLNGNNKNVDLSASLIAPDDIQTAINSLIKNKPSTIITFGNNGVLPGKAQIKVYVGDKFVSGDELNLYYYNENTHKAESIAKKVKVDSNGYTIFTIEHCSTYFLTKELINTSTDISANGNIVKNITNSISDNSNGNILLWKMISGILTLIIFTLIGIIIWQRKKIKLYVKEN